MFFCSVFVFAICMSLQGLIERALFEALTLVFFCSVFVFAICMKIFRLHEHRVEYCMLSITFLVMPENAWGLDHPKYTVAQTCLPPLR